MRWMCTAGAAVLICVAFAGPMAAAQEARSPASPSPLPTAVGAETVQGILTVEVTGLVGMEGLLVSVSDMCFKSPSTASWPVFAVRDQPIDTSPFAASGRVGLPVCSWGFHRLLVWVAATPESEPQYRCFTDFDLLSDEDIWIRIVGLPPMEAEARCALEYVVHDPTPMSWGHHE
jgi:hypothetical protein